MSDSASSLGLVLAIISLIVLLSIFVKSGARRLRIPELVVYILVGMGLRGLDSQGSFLPEQLPEVLRVVGGWGLVVMLFRVGLESNLRGLLAQSRTALGIWVGDVFVSGLFGFLTARYLLGFSLPTSLIIATSLTVTSVGVSVAIWQSAGRLRTKAGQILIDVAEMDDITGIVLMAIVLTMVRSMHSGASDWPIQIIATTIGLVTLKLVLLVTGCLLFSNYVERRAMRAVGRWGSAQAPTLFLIAIGTLVAATAEVIGLSAAIGAFFAGVMFSRDPEALRLETSYEEIYELLAPFFFVSVGFQVDPGHLAQAVSLGAVLLGAAILGKTLGVTFPAVRPVGWTTAALLGISMVPRAEIAMIIMQRGAELGEWAVSPEVFSAMVFVSAGTCLLIPAILYPLLSRYGPQPVADQDAATSSDA